MTAGSAGFLMTSSRKPSGSFPSTCRNHKLLKTLFLADRTADRAMLSYDVFISAASQTGRGTRASALAARKRIDGGAKNGSSAVLLSLAKVESSLGGHPKPAIEGHFKTGQR